MLLELRLTLTKEFFASFHMSKFIYIGRIFMVNKNWVTLWPVLHNSQLPVQSFPITRPAISLIEAQDGVLKQYRKTTICSSLDR